HARSTGNGGAAIVSTGALIRSPTVATPTATFRVLPRIDSTVNQYPFTPSRRTHMRKVALLCAATVIGALGITAVASAIQGQQGVKVALQRNRAGTEEKHMRQRTL